MPAERHELVLHYPFASSADSQHLRLAAPVDSEAPIFERALQRPRRTADQLRALISVVQARHHVPASMLDRILRESDPIVTASDGTLRFEGFSGCCGVHARVDLLPDALGPGCDGRGTVNVDFNPKMIAALAQLGVESSATISMANTSVALSTDGDAVVEKQVALPTRWLRALVEVQAVQERMMRVATFDAPAAIRFIRSLPRASTRRPAYLQPTNSGLRLTRSPGGEAVPAGGLERLCPLEPLLFDADQVHVFSDEATSATGWVVEFDDSRFTLTLSPTVWRGFSGEGQALTALAEDPDQVSLVRSALRWGNTIDTAALARTTTLTQGQVTSALRVLGTRGGVGFDLAEQRYFHRELPFDCSSIEALQPRLAAARRLVALDRVRVERAAPDAVVLVSTSDVEHRVAASGELPNWSCTCPWYAKHRSSRGPCKHILAAQIELDE